MPTSTTIHTVGHGTRSVDAFIGILHRAGVERVVDVRVSPGSKRNPQFAREALAAALEGAGIGYAWRKELGGFRRPRPGSRHVAIGNASFRGYADHMETPEFERVLSWLIESSAQTPTAIMCAESVWWRCHRRMIADALVTRGVLVVHLLDAGSGEHALSSEARVEDGRLVYDVGAQSTLG